MDENTPADLSKALERAAFEAVPPPPRSISDAQLVQLGYEAITEWMTHPTMKQATLIGRLIELYEQSGRGFISGWALTEDDYEDSDDRGPCLRVIEGGTD